MKSKINIIVLFFFVSNYIFSQQLMYRTYSESSGVFEQARVFYTSMIADDFGPRDLSDDWHGGVDYNSAIGDDDHGDLILAPESGTIVDVNHLLGSSASGGKYIILDSGSRRYLFMHVFYPSTDNTMTMDDGKIHCKFMLDYPDKWAIIFDVDNSLHAIGQVEGLVEYNGDTLSVTNQVNPYDPICPLGNSGATNSHLHFNTIPNNISNYSDYTNYDPLQFIEYSAPTYDITTWTELNPAGWALKYPGTLSSNPAVRVSLYGESPNTKRYNVVMDVNDVELLIKKAHEVEFQRIKGANEESIISHGAKIGQERINHSPWLDIYPGNIHEWGRTGINSNAYNGDTNGSNAMNPWDEYYFTDFIIRIHKNDALNDDMISYSYCPSDSRYNDGIYDAIIRVTNVRNLPFSNDSEQFTIDNFKPFIQQVRMEVNDNVIYDKGWSCCGDGIFFDPISVTPPTQSDLLQHGMTIHVDVSEPLNSLQLDIPYFNEYDLIGDQTGELSYTFTISNININESESRALIFTGQDVSNDANNLLNLYNYTNGDCVTLPTRGSNGWDNDDIEQGVDSVHIIPNYIPNQPDLTPHGQYVSSSTVQAGGTITAGCSENNSGNASASSNVISIYLTQDTILTPGENGDVYIDYISIPSVIANSCSIQYSKDIQVPSNTAPGSYYLYFWVDGDEIIDESDEENNFGSVPITVIANSGDVRPFITTWKTDNPGISNNTSITIPTYSGETYDYDIDWNGDGVYDEFEVAGDATHDYGVAGTYTVQIRGTFPRIYCSSNQSDRRKLMTVEQWGDIAWSSMSHAFKQAIYLVFNASDVPDLSNVQDMSFMFHNAYYFNSNISNWNVSNVTNMHGMFQGAVFFNDDISNWNVSNVTDMGEMFLESSSFNQNLSNWNISNVEDIYGMFAFASSFNSDLSNWDVSNITSLNVVFYEATSFNGDISTWDVSNVTTMQNMFHEASSFNGDLSNWDVSNVEHVYGMFHQAISFNQNLGNWNLSSISTMHNMLDNSGLSIHNYDNTLIGWESQGLSSLSFGALGLEYCNGSSARESLINNYGWEIIGDYSSCVSQRPFITTWQTDNPGIFNHTSITIPSYSGEIYNYHVDWNNDGIYDEFNINGRVTHDFGVAGTYTIGIVGEFPGIYFNNGGDKEKILSVDQWGDIAWTSMRRAFNGASNLTSSASDSPDLSSVTDMTLMFNNATYFNGNLNNWDVSSITSMAYMFQNASSFNGDLNAWNVSNVTTMREMFRGASSFNGDISNWDVSNVMQTELMFLDASSFNGDIGNWDVSNVNAMYNMFQNASSFDRNLGGWDISNVYSMTDMLDNSGLSLTNYDNTLIGWESQEVTNLTLGALGLEYCNGASARESLINNYGWTIEGDELNCSSQSQQPFITTWQTDNAFDDRSNIRTSNSTSITIPTYIGETYDYDVDWNNDGVYDEFGITGDATHDYGIAGTYTVRIKGIFPRIYFNNSGDKAKIISIDQWGEIPWSSMNRAFYGAINMVNNASDAPDLSNAQDMSYMFIGASSFNQDMGDWDISPGTNLDNMLDLSGLSTENYDNTLIGWESQGLYSLNLGANGLTYCSGEAARNSLINTYGWNITGDYLDCSALPVEFNSFNARLIDNEQVRLGWQTAYESNNKGYEVQRSKDYVNWQALDFVESIISPSVRNNYEYIDEAPFDGQNFYRLKQIDNDGAFSFSKIESVYLKKEGEIAIYPNPTTGKFVIEGIIASEITITDSFGRIMKKEFVADNNFDISELPSGVYFVSINTNYRVVIQRVVKS